MFPYTDVFITYLADEKASRDSEDDGAASKTLKEKLFSRVKRGKDKEEKKREESKKQFLEEIEENGGTETGCPVVDLVPVSKGYFTNGNKVTCAVPCNKATAIFYGTANGVYLHHTQSGLPPRMILYIANVTQIEILEKQKLLLVLANNTLRSFNVPDLDPARAFDLVESAPKYTTTASFFKVGRYMDRTLVCAVRTNEETTAVKVMVPLHDENKDGELSDDANNKKMKVKGGHLKTYTILRDGNPNCISLNILKKHICIGYTTGIDVVNLNKVSVQSLLDPRDPSLGFMFAHKETHPIAIYRIKRDFLLCYKEFSFYIDAAGRRIRNEFFVQWQRNPQAFGFLYPYLLAFEDDFVEVRDIMTGELVQVIVGDSVKCVYSDSATSAKDTVEQAPRPNYHQRRMSLYNPESTPLPELQLSKNSRNNSRKKTIYFRNGSIVYRIKIATNSLLQPLSSTSTDFPSS